MNVKMELIEVLMTKKKDTKQKESRFCPRGDNEINIISTPKKPKPKK